MSLTSRAWTDRMTFVLGQVMQAAIPRCRGLKLDKIVGLSYTRKTRDACIYDEMRLDN